MSRFKRTISKLVEKYTRLFFTFVTSNNLISSIAGDSCMINLHIIVIASSTDVKICIAKLIRMAINVSAMSSFIEKLAWLLFFVIIWSLGTLILSAWSRLILLFFHQFAFFDPIPQMVHHFLFHLCISIGISNR